MGKVGIGSSQEFFGEILPKAFVDKAPLFNSYTAHLRFIITHVGGNKTVWEAWDVVPNPPRCERSEVAEVPVAGLRCTIKEVDFLRILNLQATAPQYFMMGRLFLEGELLLALQLQRVVDDWED